MRKLKLDLDALGVDSFDTLGGTKAKGTVLAEQGASTYYTLCVGPCAYTYDDPTCPACPTCAYTCDDPTCPACPTCAESCNGSCDATCYETCGVSCWGSCGARICYNEP
jgi:hypothetical protein